MNSNEYQNLAARTLIDGPEQPLSVDEVVMLATALALHARLGAFTEKLKKNVLHRHQQYDVADFLDDIGDLEVDLTAICEDKASAPSYLSDRDTMTLWNAIGLLGESSEVAQLLLNYGLEPGRELEIYPDARKEWTKELGDVAWYHAAIATKLGLQMSDIQEANIDKLKKRFPKGFTTEDSVARVDVEPTKDLTQILGQAQQDLAGRVRIEGVGE
ncbi:hypothetical protein D0962_01830 [Leptolyngbyaceae cyanobacterium CCMR0082]|uniref:NTP pyrophosphohydrolase MazG-like domain-containing protein n=1 Tax=Adonisia turfae CCMR0082 TaxID=2304604 RepID=A0A6M0RZ90_9CYAN|nr:MazG nucleotide pyrophosphohydrolase domain-containing protein [Adonisia turfae]NEZ61525.1 hypothetical protein [Adonisia turfae CCMR0082]